MYEHHFDLCSLDFSYMKENIGLGKYYRWKLNKQCPVSINTCSTNLPQGTILQKNLAGEVSFDVSYFDFKLNLKIDSFEQD